MKIKVRALGLRMVRFNPVLIVLILFGLTIGAIGQGAKEVWFTNRATICTDQGNGSYANPYHGGKGDGSDTCFDDILRNTTLVPPGTVIRLLPGTYHTLGKELNGFTVQSGWTLKGAGIDKTIIKLKPVTSGTATILHTENSANSDIAVSDMTLDCNYQQNTTTVQGIRLYGKQNLRIERVKVINAAGVFSAAEVIKVDTSPSTLSPATGVMISECEVSSYQGSTCWAIRVDGKTQTGSEASPIGKASGIIEKCIVNFPTNANMNWVAYTVVSANSFIVRNNRSFNGATGFGNDAGYSENLIVQDNIFMGLRGQNAGAITLYSSQRSLLQNNLVEIGTNGEVVCLAMGKPNQTSYCANWTVRNNVFRYGPSVSSGFGIALWPAPGLPQNCTFENNRMESTMLNNASSDSSLYWFNNTDFAGNNGLISISGLQNQTPQTSNKAN